MTDKIIEAAREAGVSITVHSGKPGGPWTESHFVTPNLERFYALARADALEDAAKLLETKKEWRGGKWISTLSPETASAIANAIRALKEQQHG